MNQPTVVLITLLLLAPLASGSGEPSADEGTVTIPCWVSVSGQVSKSCDPAQPRLPAVEATLPSAASVASFSVSWTPTSADAEEFAALMVACWTDASGQRECVGDSATGPSPLVLELSNLPEGSELVVLFDPERSCDVVAARNLYCAQGSIKLIQNQDLHYIWRWSG